MKKAGKMMILATVVFSMSACMHLDRQQRNALAGAVIGGAVGQLAGGDTASTVGGAALGGVIGSQVNKNGGRHYR